MEAPRGGWFSAGGSCSAVAGLVLLLLLLTAWFALGSDRRGRTARLQADAWYHHAWLPTIVLDGDLDLSDEYGIFGDFYGLGLTPPGRAANVFGVGPAVFELPAFLVGHVAALALGQPSNGFSPAEVTAALFTSVLAGFASVVFAWRTLQRSFGTSGAAAAVAALVFLGGPSVYYAVRQPGYSHPFGALFVAWLIDVLDASFRRSHGPRSARTWIALGALTGAAALARPQLALWSVVLVIAAIDDVRRIRASPSPSRAIARSFGNGLLAWLSAVAVFTPQLVVWRLTYGSSWLVPQGQGFLWWSDPAWTSVLFSSRNGLLPWTPLYALALIGLVASLRRHAWTAGSLLAGFLLQLAVNAAAWDWWAGGSFGGRRFDSCYAAFAFGLGFLLLGSIERARWRTLVRASCWALTVILASANVALAAQRSGATVPIGGGRAAWSTWVEKAPPGIGTIAGWASWIANAPAQWAFAQRHGVPFDRYDRVVGVHALEDRFPGLNADAQPPTKELSLDPRYPNVFGIVEADPGAGGAPWFVIERDRARLLVGFNRRGAVRFTLEGAAPRASTEIVRLSFNGEPIASASVGESVRLSSDAVLPRRGTNVLVIEGPPSVTLRSLAVHEAQPPTRSRP